MNEFSRCRHLCVVRLCLVGLLACMLSGDPVRAQQADSQLPEAARQAMRRGIAATKQGEWELAIRYFSEAQEAAPGSHTALFNLGLACDKAGGRELVSIPWYRAYLAAAPHAANAEQVRQRIAELEIAVESRVRKLLRWDQEVVPQLLGAGEDVLDMALAYGDVALAQYEAGDTPGALETISKQGSGYSRDEEYYDLVEAQTADGDIEGAERTIALMKDEYDYKVYAYCTLAETQARLGDMSAAQELLRRASEAATHVDIAQHEYGAYLTLGRTQAKLGDAEGAKKSLARAVAQVRYMPAGDWLDDQENVVWYRLGASAQAKAGDLAGARKTFDLARRQAGRFNDKEVRASMYGNIAAAEAGVKLRDIAAARAAIEGIPSGAYRDGARAYLAITLAKEGHVVEAVKEAELIEPAGSEVYYQIVLAQLKEADAAAEQTAAMMSRGTWRDRAYKEISLSRARRGDTRGARETATSIDDIKVKLGTFKDIAKIQLESGKEESVEESVSWWYFGRRNLETSFMSDLPGYLKGIKGAEPREALEKTVQVLSAMTSALKELKYMEEFWQKHRKPEQ